MIFFICRELEDIYWNELASGNYLPPIYGADIDHPISDPDLEVNEINYEQKILRLT